MGDPHSGACISEEWEEFTHTYRVVQDICKAQQVENFVFHDLRHCAVTNLADAGVDTETIMKIVGHSSVEMFLRYRTIMAEKLDDAMSRLNTLITRRSPASSQVLEIATV
ncbi:MAG: tyrosine-type recombinase/integrase [Nitrospira sp.]|nr:tyrosine-type recombinase/integrase [Nitrospira sp.]